MASVAGSRGPGAPDRRADSTRGGRSETGEHVVVYGGRGPGHRHEAIVTRRLDDLATRHLSAAGRAMWLTRSYAGWWPVKYMWYEADVVVDGIETLTVAGPAGWFLDSGRPRKVKVRR